MNLVQGMLSMTQYTLIRKKYKRKKEIFSFIKRKEECSLCKQEDDLLFENLMNGWVTLHYIDRSHGQASIRSWENSLPRKQNG